MPLPKPRKNEKKDDFISRCMSELKDEYPDQDQRLAICHKQWGGKKSIGLLPRVYGRVWAILPEKLRLMAETQKETYSEAEFEAYRSNQATKFKDTKGKIGMLPLYGVVTPRASILGMLFGGTPLDLFGAAFDEMVADPEVGAIVFDVDSPGGSVYGVHELAEKIYSARSKEKPIIASVNGLAASAAYWLASAADEIVVTPSGEVGSIGVYAVHTDISKLEEKFGIKTTLVSAGKFKTEGNPHEPLTEEGTEAIQARVDDYYKMMVLDIAKYRGVDNERVFSGFGEGRVVGAQDGRKAKMADKIATLEQVMSILHPPNRERMAAKRKQISKWKGENANS
jgi:signal peptide peptidase SppA